jgi:hypothetical protein
MKQQETLEEAAEKFRSENPGTMGGGNNTKILNAFIAGAKWQQEQDKKMYNEMQVYQIIELIRLTGESPEFIMEQLNKPIHKNQNLKTNNI